MSSPKTPSPDNSQILTLIFAGIASMCAGGATHPLDTCKIRLQKQGELGTSSQIKYKNIFNAFYLIYKNEGFSSLYKGLTASLLREATYSTIRLGMYEPFKVFLGGTDRTHTPLWKKFAAGLCSGSCGAIVANPYDLLKVKMQSIEGREKMSFFGEIWNILKTEGIMGLYRGTLPNVTRGAILTATKMATYDHTKHLILNSGLMKDDIYCFFVCSIVTGIMLTITTAPIDLIKTRIMTQTLEHKIYNGMIDCAIKTVKQEGVKAFYKGFWPQWMRFGPFNVIQLIVWEELRKHWGIKTI